MSDNILVVSTSITQIPDDVRYVFVDIDQTLRGPLCFQVLLQLPVNPTEGQLITIRDVSGLYEKVLVCVSNESKHSISSFDSDNTKILEVKIKKAITLYCTGKLNNEYHMTWVEI